MCWKMQVYMPLGRQNKGRGYCFLDDVVAEGVIVPQTQSFLFFLSARRCPSSSRALPVNLKPFLCVSMVMGQTATPPMAAILSSTAGYQKDKYLIFTAVQCSLKIVKHIYGGRVLLMGSLSSVP